MWWLLIAFGLAAVPTSGQESRALIDLLIRKGILTHQEADELRAEVAREAGSAPGEVTPDHKSTQRLSVGMRMQAQYVHLETDVAGSAFDPPASSHGLLRRMYLTLKADLGKDWSAVFTYDFAGGGYDDAILEWKPTPELAFNFGLRKVNVGYEERASSGDIKAIERSSITRYFIEENNGRRLGAAGYRIGAFLDGRKALSSSHTFLYGVAITNPERSETFEDAASMGDGKNNTPAGWANFGLSTKFREGRKWTVGGGVGLLPDQGGVGNSALGAGHDLRIFSVFSDLQAGGFTLLAEYLTADVEGGAGTAGDARPEGYFIQPSLRLSSAIEAVVRYAWLDSDGRGVTLADAIRSAASGGTMNVFTEWYAGANWYLRGNDLKFQLGAVYGKTRDTVSGEPAEADTVGVRSQMQLQF